MALLMPLSGRVLAGTDMYRFLQVQMMLYRPGLAALSHTEAHDTRKLRISAYSHSASACVAAAQEMIVLCKKEAYASPDSPMQTPWWMNILCEYRSSCLSFAYERSRRLYCGSGYSCCDDEETS
jgi:hypothetical protein